MDIQSRKAEVEELGKKILTGLQLSSRKLVESAAANNESLVVGDGNGNPLIVPAKELLKKMTIRERQILRLLLTLIV
jgi:hypothetical protein